MFIRNGQFFSWAYLKQGVFAKGLSSDKLESRGNGTASSFALSLIFCKGNNGTKCTRFILGSKSFTHYYGKVQLLLRKASLLVKQEKLLWPEGSTTFKRVYVMRKLCRACLLVALGKILRGIQFYPRALIRLTVFIRTVLNGTKFRFVKE